MVQKIMPRKLNFLACSKSRTNISAIQSSERKKIFEEIRQGGISRDILRGMHKAFPGTRQILANMTKRSPSERLTAPLVLEELTHLVQKASDESRVVMCKFKDGLDDKVRPLYLAINIAQQVIPQLPTVDARWKQDGIDLSFPSTTKFSALRKVIGRILETASDVSSIQYNGVTYKSRAATPA